MFYQDQLTAAYADFQRGAEYGDVGAKVGKAPLSATVVCGLLRPLDLIVLFTTAVIAYLVRFSGPLVDVGLLSEAPSFYTPVSAYAVLVAFGCLLAVNIFHFSGLYSTETLKTPARTVRRLCLGWIGVAGILMMIGFLTKSSEDYSRVWSLMWFTFGLSALVVMRWLFYARVARWVAEGRLDQKMAILGSGALAERVAAHFVTSPTAGIRVSGLFNTDEDASNTGNPACRRAGNLDDLVGRIRTGEIDTVLVAMPDADHQTLLNVFERLSEVPVDIRLCPGNETMHLINRGVTHYAGLTTIDVVDRPLTDWRHTVKEIEDRILGSLILLVSLPLMAIIAVAIRIDSPGPALFRQKRYGFNNELIEIFKFRTMHVHMTDEKAEQLTERNDPRVTRIGHFLRRWSLDEIPQFINVARGEMSVVGPRPHALAPKAGGQAYHEAVPFYFARHRVKPGITGWAQVNGWRGPTDTVRQLEKRVEHDLYYIDHWSLWFDLKIVLLTLFKGFRSENAF